MGTSSAIRPLLPDAPCPLCGVDVISAPGGGAECIRCGMYDQTLPGGLHIKGYGPGWGMDDDEFDRWDFWDRWGER